MRSGHSLLFMLKLPTITAGDYWLLQWFCEMKTSPVGNGLKIIKRSHKGHQTIERIVTHSLFIRVRLDLAACRLKVPYWVLFLVAVNSYLTLLQLSFNEWLVEGYYSCTNPPHSGSDGGHCSVWCSFLRIQNFNPVKKSIMRSFSVEQRNMCYYSLLYFCTQSTLIRKDLQSNDEWLTLVCIYLGFSCGR